MKIKKLFTLLGGMLLSIGVWAQTDVTSTYIVNPSFEYSAEGKAYTEETKLSSSESIYGWTLPSLGGDLYDIQVTPKSSASTGANTFGQALPSEGSYYFYNRKGWSTVTTSLTQTTTLPAGKYYITVDYKAAEWSGYRTKLGFKVADTELVNMFCAARFSATTTYFADIAWKTLGAWFTVESEGSVKIEIIETLGGNDRRADICLDNVRLYKWDLDDQTNYDNATKSNPMDVTAKFVTNPYFDSNVTGWTSTTGYQNNTRATNQAGAISGGFYENWNPSAKTSGKMYQTLTGLPDGIFKVTASVMVNQTSGANVSLYAGSQKTAITGQSAPENYSVQATVSGGSMEIGLELGAGNTANWIGLDNVKLEYLGFDVDAAIEAANEQATAAESHLTDKCYTGYISALQDAIDAVQALDGNTATKTAVQTAASNLVTALANVTSSVADYARLNTAIAQANAYSVVNTANASDYADAISAAETVYTNASAESTAATILGLQTYKVADYDWVKATYTEAATLGTWTENFAEDLSGEGYVNGGATYFNEWGTNTRTAKQSLALPAGDYALSVIERGQVGTSGYMYCKIGDDETRVPFLMKGNRGRGVDTNGDADFSESGSYTCGGEGFGWEYRFLTFTLAEETTVEIGVSATFANAWVSIYAPKLFTTESSIKALRLAEIATAIANVPTAKMNADVQSALNAKKSAAQEASASNTIEELETILAELNTAIANANASVAVYEKLNAAITMAESWTTDAENVTDPIRAKYNVGAYSNESTANDIYSEYQAAELAALGTAANTVYTSAIINPSFETGDMAGWTATSRNDTGVKEQSNATYGITSGASIDGSFLFNSWGGTAENDVRQTITGLPTGLYTITAVLAGFAGETLVLDGNGTNNSVVVDGDKTVGYTVTVENVRVDLDGVLVIKASNTKSQSGSDASFIKADKFTLTLNQYLGLADSDDYAALASAITAAKAKTLGFDAGEYAPYTNTSAIAALAAAQAIDPETDNLQFDVQRATSTLTGATWTANAAEVNAIYDGQFANTAANATSGDINLPGWTKVDGIRLLVKDETVDPGLAYTDGKAAVFSWGGTTLTYGAQEGYTLPLNKYEIYELTLKVSGWRDGDLPNHVSVELDGDIKQIVSPSVKAINVAEGNPFATLTFFLVPTTDNPTLKIYGNHHFTIADLQLIKAASPAELALSDTESYAYAPATRYANVTMTRTIKAGYNTVVLPFDLSEAQVADVFGGESKVYEFAEGDSEDADHVVINFTEKSEASIAANVPVLVKATAGSSSKTINGVLTSNAGLQNVETTNCVFTGNYGGNITLDEGTYFITNDGATATLYKSTGSSHMKSYRAYIAPKNGDTEVKLFIDDEDMTTAIEGLEDNVETGSEAIYTLSGQRVSKAAKGIFIMDGKKVLVK